MTLDLPQSERERLKLWLQMLKTTRQIEGEIRERLRVEHSTTLPRFDVMAALYRRPDGLKMSELSRMLMVSNGNVTGIVDRLVDDRLVTRADVEGDRRATRVRLTETGRARFEEMAVEHSAWIEELMAPLTNDHVSRMTAILTKLGRHDG